MVDISNKYLDKTGWSISMELYKYIIDNYPSNEYPVLLEFGTGESSKAFTEAKYNYFGIEHDIKYLNVRCNIVHAPIRDGWYDRNIFNKTLDYILFNYKCVDVTIVDGPPRRIGREGIVEYCNIIKSRVIIFDDVQREDDMMVMLDFCKQGNWSYEIMGSNKRFAVCTKITKK